ncbi:prevent-host-death family protein YefM [Achromatium sp. WMS3]|nr:prevent-host-death family protein YefM [Achromatium sp. WMS3]
MMELHPQTITKEGKNEFVVLPFAEYQALTELMYDYEDLKDLREAKENSKGKNSIPLEQVITEIGL